MAELAIVAAVGNGLKLSFSLFDFAYALGVAAAEIKSLASEIKLFCAVLAEVGSTMGRARSGQISAHATQIIFDILERCQDIFGEISTILVRLRAADGTDLLRRIRWTFQKPQVLLLQQSLRSCAGLLQVMLQSVAFSQSVGVRCPSPIQRTQKGDKKHRLTQSLLTAQQDLEQLEDLETLCSLEEDFDSELDAATEETELVLTQQATGDYHEAICEYSTATVLIGGLPKDPRGRQRMMRRSKLHESKRTSTLVREYFEFQPKLRETRVSKGSFIALFRLSSKTSSGQYHTLPVPKSVASRDERPLSTSSVLQLAISGQNIDHPKTSKGYLRADEACWQVLRTAVKANKIAGCWRDYGLFLGCRGIRDRYLHLHWKPLIVLKRLMKGGHGQMPTLTMRKIANIRPTEDRAPVLVFSVEESDAQTRLMEATGFL